MTFVKGKSGNPSGRPKKSRELEELIQKALENVGPESKSGNRAVDRMIEIMETGDERNSTPAGKLLMAYGYGNPKQQVSLDLSVRNHEQWQENLQARRKSKKASKTKRKRNTGKT